MSLFAKISRIVLNRVARLLQSSEWANLHLAFVCVALSSTPHMHWTACVFVDFHISNRTIHLWKPNQVDTIYVMLIESRRVYIEFWSSWLHSLLFDIDVDWTSWVFGMEWNIYVFHLKRIHHAQMDGPNLHKSIFQCVCFHCWVVLLCMYFFLFVHWLMVHSPFANDLH